MDHKALIGKTKLSKDSKHTIHLWLKLANFDIASKHQAETEISAAAAQSGPVACATLTDIHFTEIQNIRLNYDTGPRKQLFSKAATAVQVITKRADSCLQQYTCSTRVTVFLLFADENIEKTMADCHF
jgi:hypothetical protein